MFLTSGKRAVNGTKTMFNAYWRYISEGKKWSN